jgi:glycine/D-amino acid oxidase-like deaminating enzyme
LIRAAQAAGAVIMRGIRARHITTRNGVVTGVMTDVGAIPAEQILIAAGTATPTLLKEVDVHLPLRASAGAIVRTQAVPRVLDYVLAAPGQELRQDAAGHILLPTTANHQTADGPGDAPPHDLITQTLARANSLLGRDDLRCEEARYAVRPMPSDGLPVLGQAGPAGLFVAVMHSGVTLAAIAADVIAAKMQERPDRENQAALFDGFGVNRFSGN